MRVIIVMAGQTTLMDQRHVLLKPSIGFGPRVPPVANGLLNYLIDLFSAVKARYNNNQKILLSLSKHSYKITLTLVSLDF